MPTLQIQHATAVEGRTLLRLDVEYVRLLGKQIGLEIDEAAGQRLVAIVGPDYGQLEFVVVLGSLELLGCRIARVSPACEIVAESVEGVRRKDRNAVEAGPGDQ